MKTDIVDTLAALTERIPEVRIVVVTIEGGHLMIGGILAEMSVERIDPGITDLDRIHREDGRNMVVIEENKPATDH
jgi:hypothetical protein